jgi:hypothetical protein
MSGRGPTQSAARGTPVLNAGSGCIQHMEKILGLFLDAKAQAFIETLRGIDLQHVETQWYTARRGFLLKCRHEEATNAAALIAWKQAQLSEANLTGQSLDNQNSRVYSTNYDDACVGANAVFCCFSTGTLFMPSPPCSNDVDAHGLLCDVVEEIGIRIPGRTQCDGQRHVVVLASTANESLTRICHRERVANPVPACILAKLLLSLVVSRLFPNELEQDG